MVMPISWGPGPTSRIQLLVFLAQEIKLVARGQRCLEDICCQFQLAILHCAIHQRDNPLPLARAHLACQFRELLEAILFYDHLPNQSEGLFALVVQIIGLEFLDLRAQKLEYTDPLATDSGCGSSLQPPYR